MEHLPRGVTKKRVRETSREGLSKWGEVCQYVPMLGMRALFLTLQTRLQRTLSDRPLAVVVR